MIVSQILIEWREFFVHQDNIWQTLTIAPHELALFTFRCTFSCSSIHSPRAHFHSFTYNLNQLKDKALPTRHSIYPNRSFSQVWALPVLQTQQHYFQSLPFQERVQSAFSVGTGWCYHQIHQAAAIHLRVINTNCWRHLLVKHWNYTENSAITILQFLPSGRISVSALWEPIWEILGHPTWLKHGLGCHRALYLPSIAQIIFSEGLW